MINIELHSVHGPSTGTEPTGATFPLVPPLAQPAPSVIDHITAELEKLVIEGKLRKEEGPMRSAVDNAIQRRRLEQKSRPQLSPFTNLDFDSTLTTHPTFPIFPARSSRSNPNEDDSERNGTVSMGTLVRGQRSPKKVIGIGWGAGSTKGSSVPSPGTSVPPEGYVRGRSLSC